MYQQTIEEFIYGLDNNVNLEIEYQDDYNKCYYYTVKQLKKRPALLKLIITDFDLDLNAIRLLVKENTTTQ